MKKNLKIISWKNFIIIFVITIFYSYIATYSAVMKISIINPKNLLIFSIILVLYLNFATPNKLFFIKIPILKWLLVYIVIIFIWFILPNNYMDIEEFKKFIFSILFFLTMTILIANDDNQFSKTRITLLFITLLAISNNIYEFFHPFAFYSINSDYNIIGRSAGFYVDPNIAGQAILFGLIFSYEIVPKTLKIPFILLTFIGVLVTFSRGSLVGWSIIMFLFFKYRLIDKKTTIVLFMTFLSLIIFFLPLLYDLIINNFNNPTNLLNRLNFFTGSSHIDRSELERLKIGISAFNLFADNPIFGSGLSIIRHWKYSVAPHNIYLTLMAQFGLIGLFSYIYLIYTLIGNAKGEVKILGKVFLGYFLFLGLTTHNILTAYQTIIAMTLMSNMSYRSYLVYKKGFS